MLFSWPERKANIFALFLLKFGLAMAMARAMAAAAAAVIRPEHAAGGRNHENRLL